MTLDKIACIVSFTLIKTARSGSFLMKKIFILLIFIFLFIPRQTVSAQACFPPQAPIYVNEGIKRERMSSFVPSDQIWVVWNINPQAEYFVFQYSLDGLDWDYMRDSITGEILHIQNSTKLNYNSFSYLPVKPSDNFYFKITPYSICGQGESLSGHLPPILPLPIGYATPTPRPVPVGAVNCNLHTGSWQITSIIPELVGDKTAFKINGHFPQIYNCGRQSQPLSSLSSTQTAKPLVASYKPPLYVVGILSYLAGNQVESFNESQISLNPAYKYVNGKYRFLVDYCSGFTYKGKCENLAFRAISFDVDINWPSVSPTNYVFSPSPTRIIIPSPTKSPSPTPTPTLAKVITNTPAPKFVFPTRSIIFPTPRLPWLLPTNDISSISRFRIR